MRLKLGFKSPRRHAGNSGSNPHRRATLQVCWMIFAYQWQHMNVSGSSVTKSLQCALVWIPKAVWAAFHMLAPVTMAEFLLPIWPFGVIKPLTLFLNVLYEFQQGKILDYDWPNFTDCQRYMRTWMTMSAPGRVFFGLQCFIFFITLKTNDIKLSWIFGRNFPTFTQYQWSIYLPLQYNTI